MKEKQLGENDFNKSLPKLKGKCQVQESNYGPSARTQVGLFFYPPALDTLYCVHYLLFSTFY